MLTFLRRQEIVLRGNEDGNDILMQLLLLRGERQSSSHQQIQSKDSSKKRYNHDHQNELLQIMPNQVFSKKPIGQFL